jgi:hypothetical protein
MFTFIHKVIMRLRVRWNWQSREKRIEAEIANLERLREEALKSAFDLTVRLEHQPSDLKTQKKRLKECRQLERAAQEAQRGIDRRQSLLQHERTKIDYILQH